MSIPKEPRALMIQLMYLVLTAMLALNITREVLNAFVSIDESISRTNTTIKDKNLKMYEAFDAKEADDKSDRVKPWNDKAKKVKVASAEILTYLEGLKDTVVTRSGGTMLDERTGKTVPIRMEDIDAATFFFVGKDQKGGEGDVLKGKLQAFIDEVLVDLDPAEREAIRVKVPINLEDFAKSDDNPKGDWTFGNFNNVPVVAATAILSKFQSDVINAEGLIVEALYRHIDDNVLKFDELAPIAVANTSYALEGDEITATVTLAAYNKNVNPTITSSAGSVKVENGVGTIKFKASGQPGQKTVSGSVSLPINGENKSFPWKLDYYIGTTGASLALDKMNVFYIGVDNPVTVSGSGYNIEDITLSIPAAKLTKTTKNQYIVTVDGPPSPKEGIPYTISGKNKAGGQDKIMEGRIRVKMLPTPTALLNKSTGGSMEAHVLKAQFGPYASLGDDFDFAVKFEILSYDIVLVPKEGWAANGSNKGSKLAGEAKEIINRARPGDMVLFNNIRAKGPDGKVRSLNSITINVM